MNAETKRRLEELSYTLAKCKAVSDAFAGEYIDCSDLELVTMVIQQDPEPYTSLYNVMNELLVRAYTTAKELAA